MALLPFENITYRTALSEEEVIRRLTDFIEPKKVFRMSFSRSSSAKPYEGEITGRQFTINRIITYRNSFLPEITGTIQRDNNATVIHVKMRLHVFVLIFLLIWCSIVGTFVRVSVTSLMGAIQGHKIENQDLIPLGMIVLMCVLTIGAFKFESSKSKKDLQKLVEGEISSS